jgi:hypothetical protein
MRWWPLWRLVTLGALLVACGAMPSDERRAQPGEGAMLTPPSPKRPEAIAPESSAPIQARPTVQHSYHWRRDPTTGLMVAQLTTATAGRHFALYYHFDNQSADGQWLVYRHLSAPSPATLTYYRLQMESGLAVAVTPTGLTNSAFARGDWLYVLQRDLPRGPYHGLSRYHLTTLRREDLITRPGELELHFVTADDDTVVYGERAPGAPEKEIRALSTRNRADRGLFRVPAEMFHFMTNPGHPNQFIFMDSRCTMMRLGCLYDARLDTGAHAVMHSADPYLTDTIVTFVHPFFSIGGSLWSDAVIGKPNAYEPLYVRFQIGSAPGTVTSHERILISRPQFQNHTNRTRSSGWFVGDGTYFPHIGEPFIHLLRMVPGVPFEQYRLATGRAYQDPRSRQKTDEANAHMLETLDGVVWSAWETWGSDPANVQSVYLVKLPTRLRARLAKERQPGAAPGPFKPGSHVLISPRSSEWRISYVDPSGVGPGRVDRWEVRLPGNVGATQFAAADLDGDGVDDRIALTWSTSANGTWAVSASRTRFDTPSSESAAEMGTAAYSGLARRFPPLLADVDGNGTADLITVRPGPANTLLWNARLNRDGRLPTGPPGAGFTDASFGDAALDEYAFVADVNGDGYGDRVVVRPQGNAWTWYCDLSTERGFGDGRVDLSFSGGDHRAQRPLVADMDGDGRADFVLVGRDESGTDALVSYAWLKGSWVRGTFGSADPEEQPLIAHFTYFPLRR